MQTSKYEVTYWIHLTLFYGKFKVQISLMTSWIDVFNSSICRKRFVTTFGVSMNMKKVPDLVILLGRWTNFQPISIERPRFLHSLEPLKNETCLHISWRTVWWRPRCPAPPPDWRAPWLGRGMQWRPQPTRVAAYAHVGPGTRASSKHTYGKLHTIQNQL